MEKPLSQTNENGSNGLDGCEGKDTDTDLYMMAEAARGQKSQREKAK